MSGGLLRDCGSSWLIPLADLSLILFITTAASLAAPAPQQAREDLPTAAGSIAQGVPAAVFVDAPQGPLLTEWLEQYRPGPGEQLTIEGQYLPQDRARIAARAEELASEAIAAGHAPRLILQPLATTGGQSHVRALFAHDADLQMAQSLLQQVRS